MSVISEVKNEPASPAAERTIGTRKVAGSNQPGGGSTWTVARAVGETQRVASASKTSTVVGAPVPTRKRIACDPCPKSIVPFVTFQMYPRDAFDGTLAERPLSPA